MFAACRMPVLRPLSPGSAWAALCRTGNPKPIRNVDGPKSSSGSARYTIENSLKSNGCSDTPTGRAP
jgi:hypothetical protein